MSTQEVHIDGREGEGGGQILRSALSLSLLSQRPFSIANIRAGRKKPGILRQHHCAIHAAAAISNAKVFGNEIGSQELSFSPKSIAGGDHTFAIGSAGSSTLVCQTVLLPLCFASKPSTIIFSGGTHNPDSPPFDFLQKTFLPVLERMGAKTKATLIRPGFYPAGGGSFEIRISPVSTLQPLELVHRGEISRMWAQAAVSNLSLQIARKEISQIREDLGLERGQTRAYEVRNATGPGNVLIVEVESESHCEVFTGYGEKGVTAKRVASQCASQVKRYLRADAPVGSYLADQLLLPLAVAGAGRYKTLKPSDHTVTNSRIIERFLPVSIVFKECADDTTEVILTTQNSDEVTHES
jgi:RNA 3'-terminal phosphate cyclase (ATP)